MKKIIGISLLFIIVLLCTACNGSVTRDIRHSGFAVSSKFKCDMFYPKGKNDTSYKKVKYLTASNIIDKEGKIYEVSLSQVYENKMNCKRANTNIVVKAIYDNRIIKGADNKYYYLTSENGTTRYSEVLDTDNSYELYNLLLKEEDVLKVITADSGAGTYYVLKNDGNVYSYKVTKNNYSSPLRITTISIVYDKSDYNSKIIDFNYDGEESTSTYVRTEKTVYRRKITNYDTCIKYADVTCEYDMIEDTIFDKYHDRIIAYNGNILIVDYQQIFTVSN